VPGPEGNHHPFLAPFGLFSAKDGLVAIAATKDKFFALLCRAIGAADLLEDERFSSLLSRGTNRIALINELITYSNDLDNLLAALQARFAGQPAPTTENIPALVNQINTDVNAINNFNAQAGQAMDKFDSIEKGNE